MLDKIQKKLAQLPSKLASEATYQLERVQHGFQRPPLSEGDRAIVEGVKREGIYITSLEALNLSGTPQLLEAAHALMPEMLNAATRYQRQYVLVTPEQTMQHPILYQWGLQERLLNIAENYLGVPAAFCDVSFRRDLADGVQSGPRQWHIDIEDRRILKAIVYFSDVNLEDGPFEYIRKPLTPSPRVLKRSGYLSDEAIEKVIPASQWNPCVGKAGTVIFTDTCAIFHRGRVPTGAERYAMFFSYISRHPKNPQYCKPRFSKEQVLHLAEGVSPRQKEYLYWDERNYGKHAKRY